MNYQYKFFLINFKLFKIYKINFFYDFENLLVAHLSGFLMNIPQDLPVVKSIDIETIR